MTPRICLLVGANGSLTLAEATTAAREIAEPVLVLDRAEVASFPALREIAEGLAETLVVDTSDREAVCEAVAGSGASAVATFVDAHCPVVDGVNTRLFGRDAEPGRWNKDVQRELLVRHGVSRITGSVADTDEALAAAVARHGFPVVVKPVNGVASRDAWFLQGPGDQAEFRSAVRLDGTAGFVVEPYIRGPVAGTRGPHRADYVSAELFVTSAGVTGFVTDRPPLAAPFRETGIIGPTTLDAATRRAVLAKARAAHRALRLGPGAYHVEVKLTDQEPEVLEVNGRLGGYVRRLVRLGSGTDVAPAAIGAALDHPVPLEPRWHRHVAALFLQAPVGAATVERAPGRREITRRPEVLAVDHITPAGSALDWRAGTGAASVKVWLAADDDEALGSAMADCARWLADAFDFRDASGRRVRDDDWLTRLSGPSQPQPASAKESNR